MRRSVAVGLFTLGMLGLATPAWAQDGQDRPGQDDDAFVVLSGRADVPEGQQVGDLVVFHGSATVDGTVNGSLTAFDAPVTISGQVDGDVVVFNGRVELSEGAEVTGDVVSRSAPVVDEGATIGGETRRIQTNVNWDGFGWAGRLAWWLAVSVSTLVVGVVLLWLLGRGAPRIPDAAWTGIGPSIGWGLLAFFGVAFPGHHRPGHHRRNPPRPRRPCRARAHLRDWVRRHGLDRRAPNPARADRLDPGVSARLGDSARTGVGAHPGRPGRLGGHRPWPRRSNRGHLAGQNHQPPCPGSRLKLPVPAPGKRTMRNVGAGRSAAPTYRGGDRASPRLSRTPAPRSLACICT
jgi:Polymer-forming cytoskeletal